MKFVKSLKFIFAFVLLNHVMVFGQISDKNWELMLIREDKVYPSTTTDYETSLTDLKTFLDDNKVEGFNYFVHLQDNYTYSHVTPINELKDLNNGIRAYFSKKVNNPEFDTIINELANNISSYNYYVVQYKPELSYVPKGTSWGEGTPYRKWNYYYFYPGTQKDVEEVLAAYKQLYADKNIEMGFRVFEGYLGVKQPLYILTTWAKNPLDYQTQLQKTSGLIGDDGAALWQLLMGFVQETKSLEGWFLPQYSFAPGVKLAE